MSDVKCKECKEKITSEGLIFVCPKCLAKLKALQADNDRMRKEVETYQTDISGKIRYIAALENTLKEIKWAAGLNLKTIDLPGTIEEIGSIAQQALTGDTE